MAYINDMISNISDEISFLAISIPFKNSFAKNTIPQ